jgi:hypothetical protein
MYKLCLPTKIHLAFTIFLILGFSAVHAKSKEDQLIAMAKDFRASAQTYGTGSPAQRFYEIQTSIVKAKDFSESKNWYTSRFIADIVRSGRGQGSPEGSLKFIKMGAALFLGLPREVVDQYVEKDFAVVKSSNLKFIKGTPINSLGDGTKKNPVDIGKVGSIYYALMKMEDGLWKFDKSKEFNDKKDEISARDMYFKLISGSP